MTTTLLMRLAGPMQSWGTQSRFRDRDTGREPSKSGVVGLLCAALGRPRSAPVADLAALQMGVRVDCEGTFKRDYQTAGGSHRRGASYGVARAENSGTETVVSTRAYLADASFLVGLEASTPDQEVLLTQLDAALAAPVWPMYLGRKSYTPSEPVRLPDMPPEGPGLVDAPLVAALEAYPWASVPQHIDRVRLVLESNAGDRTAEIRDDWPLSFESTRRKFAPRYVRIEFRNRPAEATAVAEG